jgi:hypothetical protein
MKFILTVSLINKAPYRHPTFSLCPMKETNMAPPPPSPPHPPTHTRPAVLSLSNFPSVMELLQPLQQREMAVKIVQVRGGGRGAWGCPLSWG